MDAVDEFQRMFGQQRWLALLVAADGAVMAANAAAEDLLRGLGNARSIIAAAPAESQKVGRRLLEEAWRGEARLWRTTLGEGAGMRQVEFSASAWPRNRAILLIGRDATAEMIADAAGAEMNAMYRRAQELSGLGVFTHNLQTGLIRGSPQLNAIFGFDEQKLITVAEFVGAIHPDDRDRVAAALDAGLRSHTPRIELEYRVLGPGRAVRHLVATATVFADAAGEPTQVFGTVQDVTARVVAAQSARHLNRTYCVLSDIDQLLIRTRDEEKLCSGACDIAVAAGGFLLAWLGYTDESCTSVAIRGFAATAPEVRPVLEEILGPTRPECVFTCEAIRAGTIQSCNDIATDPAAASWRQAALVHGYRSMVALPLKVDDGVIGSFNLYAGVPDYFDAEELRLLDRLAHDIAFGIKVCRREAAAQELEERLRQSQKMEAIGQLAGGVAHDFNNIVAVVRLQADLLAMSPHLPPSVYDGLQQIRGAAERAAELTRQLLMFSRRQLIQTQAVEVNQRIGDLARMLQRMITEAVELRLDLHPAPLHISADPSMFDQIVMNLAINARDAMPRGGRLSVRTRPRVLRAGDPAVQPDLPPGAYVEIMLADTGTGIPAEVLPHIFEPFFTTKAAGKGTGLGLATVFGVVKQHHGAIRLNTEVGHGTVFEILLPAIVVAPVAPAKGLPPESAGGCESILVVEDEPSVRLVTRAILERYGYTVLEAADGVQALVAWQQARDRITLLVTDLVMPGGLSGQDLARRLRLERPQLQVVYTSGYNDDVAGRPLELHRGEKFLQKPFPPDQLLNAVRELLDRAAR